MQPEVEGGQSYVSAVMQVGGLGEGGPLVQAHLSQLIGALVQQVASLWTRGPEHPPELFLELCCKKKKC